MITAIFIVLVLILLVNTAQLFKGFSVSIPKIAPLLEKFQAEFQPTPQPKQPHEKNYDEY